MGVWKTGDVRSWLLGGTFLNASTSQSVAALKLIAGGVSGLYQIGFDDMHPGSMIIGNKAIQRIYSSQSSMVL